MIKTEVLDVKKQGIYQRALALAIPFMIQSGITNAVTLVDNIMVGSLGTESMTAVSIVGQLIFVFNLAIFGGLSGPGIFGAQYFGNEDMEGVKDVFRLKWYIGMACAIAGILAFVFFGPQMIQLYLHSNGSSDIDPDLTLRLGFSYLNIMLIGLIPFAVSNIYATTLRETNETIIPMVAGVSSVVIDIVFNYILIYGKFGMPRLEVKGAAIATVMARIVELLIVVIWSHILIHKHEFLQGVYKKLSVPKDIFANVMKKGTPVFLNEFMWAGAMAALTQCYSLRGLEIVAGLNISNALCNLFNVVFIAMGHAVGIVIGQMLGASEYEEARKGSIKLMWFTGVLCAIVAVILVILSGFYPDFYDTTDEVRRIGQLFIIVTACYFPVQGFLNALYFTLRSGGRTIITVLFDSVFNWVLSVPVAFVLSYMTGMSVLVIYAIVQSLDIVKIIIGYILVKKGIWVKNLVKVEE